MKAKLTLTLNCKISKTYPLVVSLTAPTANSSVAGKATVTLSASTSKSGTTLSKVEFYNGTTLLGSATTAPYSYNWTDAATGTYSLTAKVTDSRGLTQTSSPVSFQVKAITTPPTASLSTPQNNASLIAPATVTFSANAAAVGTGILGRHNDLPWHHTAHDDLSSPRTMRGL